jgi:MFS family permease
MPTFATTPRAAILAVYGGFGACVGAWAGAIPVITKAAEISSTDLGLGLTGFNIAYVISMWLAARLATVLTNRTALLLLLPLNSIATLALLSSVTPATFFAGLIAFGVLLGLLDLFMNAEASAIEHEMRKPIFAAFHGAASTGMPLLAIISSFVSVGTSPVATGLIAMVPMAIALVMVQRATPPRPLAVSRSARGEQPLRYLPLVMMGLAAGLVIAGETAAIMWSARLLDEQAPELAAIAGLGAAFFGVCNAVLRYPGDRLRRLFGDIPLMLGSLLAAIAGFAMLGISTGFTMSVIAFAIVGFGTALLVPCLFALAASYVPQNRAAGIGFVAIIAGIPRTLAPWIFGWMAAIFSTTFAFGLCAVMFALALVIVIELRRTANP